MTLYEINEALMEAFERCIDTDTGEILEDTSALESLEMERETKIENICLMIKNYLAEAEAIKAEKLKLAARQSTAENRAEWLKKYLVRNVEAGEKHGNARYQLGWRRSESVVVTDLADLPEAYLVKKIEADKKAIKASIKAGYAVNGAVLIENQNIQIK